MNSNHPLLILAVVAVGLTLTVTGPLYAAAGDDDSHRVAPTSTVDDADGIVETLADYNIEVVNPDDWQLEDLHSALAGAQALPQAVWEAIEGPVQLEYVDRPCMFSMGRYTRRCPTFDEDQPRRFFIYQPTPLVGEGPVEQLQILTRAEQRDLQIRRAVVHMAMVHLDEHYQWSEDHRWRAINGWPAGSGEPMNQDPWGYSRYLGMHSARLDLFTFAEQFFVRPIDLLLEPSQDDQTVDRRLNQLDRDQMLDCRQFTKRRVFNDQLAELDENWSEPTRLLPTSPDDDARCPAFERWARPDQVEGFELLLASAATNQPESLFGHLLLHVRYKDDPTPDSDGVEPVYRFGPITSTDVDPVEYWTRGFLGGFPSILETNSLRGIEHHFLHYQQRDLRRYRLQLTGEQKRHLLQRLWEAQRQIRYSYLFLSDNGASLLLDLLDSSLDLEVPRRRGLVTMPTDVLDVLAQVENSEQGPLLKEQVGTRPSNQRLAGQALLERRGLIQEIVDHLDDRPAAQRELEQILEEFSASKPQQRQQGYEQARSFFTALLAEKPTLARPVVEVMYLSLLIEQYFSEMANFAQRSIYARTHQDVSPTTIDEVLDQRRRLYEHDDIEARMQALHELTKKLEQKTADAPRRKLTDQEQQVVEYAERARSTYKIAHDLHTRLVETYKPDWTGVDYLDDPSAVSYENQDRMAPPTQSSSGRNTFLLGGRYQPLVSAPALTLSYSLLWERLGEIRQRGHRADVGVRLLGVDASIPISSEAPSNLQLDLVVLNYQNLNRTPPPLRRGFLDRLGWGLDARLVHDGRRNLWAGAELTPSVLLSMWSSQENINHLVVSAGLGARYDVIDTQHLLLGVTGSLSGQFHLYGDYANVLRLTIGTGQYAGPEPSWRYDYTARASVHHLVARFRDRSLLVMPFVEWMQTTRDYRNEAPDPGFRSWKTGVELKLPF